MTARDERRLERIKSLPIIPHRGTWYVSRDEVLAILAEPEPAAPDFGFPGQHGFAPHEPVGKASEPFDWRAEGYVCAALHRVPIDKCAECEAAAAQPISREDHLAICVRCLREKECLLIPVVDGDSEYLCAKCISEMLAEAHTLLEQARAALLQKGRS